MRLAYFQIALAMMIIGINIPASKSVLAQIPVFTFLLVRTVLACVVLLPLCATRSHGLFPRIGLAGWGALVLQALTGIVLFSGLLLFGMRMTSALSAGIITSFLPAAVALLSLLFLGEKLDRRKGLATVLAVCGILTLNVHAIQDTSFGSLIGNALILLAVLCEACYTIITKKIALAVPALQAATWLNIFCLGFIAPFGVAEMMSHPLADVPMETWGMLVWISLSASVLCFFLWYTAIGRVEVAVAGMLTACTPLASTLVAVFFLGETASLAHGIGVLSIIAAIALAAGPLQPARCSLGPGPSG